jgi:hypothetical protein
LTDAPRRSIPEKVRRALNEGGLGLVLARAWRRAVRPLRRALGRNAGIVARCRFAGDRVVHVIGDSHTAVCRGVYPFRVTWLGSATAHNLGRPGNTTQSHEKLIEALRHVNKQRDLVLLIVGEVDCRIHVYEQYVNHSYTKSFGEIISATIARYGTLVENLKAQGYRVVLQSVSGAPYQGNIFGVEHYANDETRACIVREFNRQLSAWCSDSEVEYFDTYSVASDERGFIRRGLTADGTHLDASALPIYTEWVDRVVLRGSAK